jgi:hypothetical protein
MGTRICANSVRIHWTSHLTNGSHVWRSIEATLTWGVATRTYNWARSHVLDQASEEGLGREIGIVLLEVLLSRLLDTNVMLGNRG